MGRPVIGGGGGVPLAEKGIPLPSTRWRWFCKQGSQLMSTWLFFSDLFFSKDFITLYIYRPNCEHDKKH